MELSGPPGLPIPSQNQSGSAPLCNQERPKAQILRVADVHLYRLCEDLTEVLLYFMVVFSPWAFGTTQQWSIWTMNSAGFVLGLLLLFKLWIRHKGYRPARLDSRAPVSRYQVPLTPDPDRPHTTRSPQFLTVEKLTAALAVLTISLLLYCFIAAINARATYHPQDLSFVYRHYPNWLPQPQLQKWLPASFDTTRSWNAFWGYLALACSFWALRDWLLGKSAGEERAAHAQGAEPGREPGHLVPARLRRLLWVLSISGGLLAVESIAQRLEGSGKLLFVVKPHVNPEGETQFGPFAYRANASQYFNLLWPICLGFWWTLQRGNNVGRVTPGAPLEKQTPVSGAHGVPRPAFRHAVLLICVALMAACPIISTSRGGAFVTLGLMIFALLFLFIAHFLFPARRPEDKPGRGLVLVFVVFLAALGAGLGLGWKALKPRLGKISEGMQGREQTYGFARPMVTDYPVYGTGPGTFEPVFQLYRKSPDTYWPAQLHNDWLETRITFGWVGSALIGLSLFTVLVRWFLPGGGIHGGRRFVGLIWLALAGCLIHARFDFPFQIYSIQFLFVIWCAMLFTLGRKTKAQR